MTDVAEYLTRLNDPQRQAVRHDGPSLMIVAGAGTGKTGTLAARVAHLLDQGVAPEKILLLTFTRRAAQEMLSRADRMATAGNASRVWGGTFHSVANRLLRIHGQAIGLDPSFTVIDQGDSRELFGVVRTEVADTGARRFPKKETLGSIYDRMVATQRRLSDVLSTDFPWCNDHAEAIAEICTRYTQRKRRRNVLDYDDLLLFWRALVTNPTMGPVVCGRVQHVLVDEFQDTNPVQADIVHAYGDQGASITVVGDDAQAIYGFRNATVANMWAFPDRRPGTVQLDLEENYRSITPILELANEVLLGGGEDNPHFEKRLWTRRRGQRRPRLVIVADERAQSEAVADRVLELREEGMSLMDQAVLFRAAHHSDLLELELTARDIPFVKFGGLKFLEAAHVKDLLASLRILDNPRDELAWHRLLRLLPGVGPASARRVLAELGLESDETVSPDEPLRRFLDGVGSFPAAARESVGALRQAMRDARGEGETQPAPATQVEALAAALGPLFDENYDRSAARKADLEQLGVIAGSFADRSRLLTELVLDPPSRTGDFADEPHLDDDYLVLSTIHSAKGGEWRAVHLIHAVDGNLPSDMALNEKGGLDEERRLAYVAITRAKDILDVYAPLRYHHRRTGLDDAHNFAPLSRFFSPHRRLFEQVGSEQQVRSAAAEAAANPVFGVADEVDAQLSALWD